MRKKLLGEEHPDVATSLNNLANLYRNQGRDESAEPLLVEALEMRRRMLGEAHPAVALSMNDLASFYESQGRYKEAEPLYLDSLERYRRVLGENHPYTRTVRGNYQRLQEKK